MNKQHSITRGTLGAEITRASSKQTYYTFLLLADRQRAATAFMAYGYFRWVDDMLDGCDGSQVDKVVFVKRQRALLEACCQGEFPDGLTPEEQLLVSMVQSDTGEHPGLRSYLDNMMAVMEFDVARRGRLVSQSELDVYSRRLAVAVTDAMFYFIGHDDPAPDQYGRYHAVTAAHITHMLRDAYEDVEMGYFNIPQETLQQHGIQLQDIDTQAYRQWVGKRVALAREYFRIGMEYISHVKNFRTRLAGYAYAARFEWVLDAIERDHFRLRPDYSQRKGIWAAIKMGWSVLVSLLAFYFPARGFAPVVPVPGESKEL